MQTWHFSEAAYPYLPPEEEYESIRVSLPNGVIDPERSARLWDRYLAEWQAADQIGINVMLNEHHSTATCMNSAAPVVAGALARLTEHARILLLGNPVSNRKDPVRIAEEMALLDVLCHGRLDVGFVRGVPWEVSATNSPPTGMSERMWEAIELIRKAWISHDGPFNWEGPNFSHRQVNIWPRPYQQPEPPVWISTTSASSAARIADHGLVLATFLQGHTGTKKIFDAYRDRAAANGDPTPADDRFAYAGLTYTGRTDAEGYEGARKLLWYLRSNKAPAQYGNPPGYLPYHVRAMALAGKSFGPAVRTMDLEELIDFGIVFAGSPATVRGQIERFYERVGGFGHLLMLAQSGFMEHEETLAGIRCFGEQVLPSLSSLGTTLSSVG